MRIGAFFAFLACLDYGVSTGLYASGVLHPGQFVMTCAWAGGALWSGTAGLLFLVLRSQMRNPR